CARGASNRQNNNDQMPSFLFGRARPGTTTSVQLPKGHRRHAILPDRPQLYGMTRMQTGSPRGSQWARQGETVAPDVLSFVMVAAPMAGLKFERKNARLCVHF